jgi:hypothetical protein
MFGVEISLLGRYPGCYKDGLGCKSSAAPNTKKTANATQNSKRIARTKFMQARANDACLCYSHCLS